MFLCLLITCLLFSNVSLQLLNIQRSLEKNESCVELKRRKKRQTAKLLMASKFGLYHMCLFVDEIHIRSRQQLRQAMI